MERLAEAEKQCRFELSTTTATVQKEMVSSPARRIGRLTVEIHVSGAFSDEQKRVLEDAARSCPVTRSLHPDVEVLVTLEWD